MEQQFKTTSTMAVVSLVCGILAWTLLPVFGGIAAVITGHMARGELRRRTDLEGDTLAVIGLILGYTSLAVIVLSVLVIFLFLGGMAFFATM